MAKTPSEASIKAASEMIEQADEFRPKLKPYHKVAVCPGCKLKYVGKHFHRVVVCNLCGYGKKAK